jgi:hypothetical protein
VQTKGVTKINLQTFLIVGFSILLGVYSQSQIKPPYATQYSVFTPYYINLHNMFRPLIVAIHRSLKRDFKDFNTHVLSGTHLNYFYYFYFYLY